MAKRDKLTQRQKRQIAKTQQRRQSAKQPLPETSELGPTQEGLMVSRYGEQADVFLLPSNDNTHEDHLDVTNTALYRCFLRQNLGAPVPGDRIQFRLNPQNIGVIEHIHTRQSVLERPSYHQGIKPVVANIDRVFVVIAPLPDFSSVLLDRYLIALESAQMDIILVANKWDLQSEIESQEIEPALKIYADLGYPICYVSTFNELGKDTLTKHIAGHASILVGQSGVGKSSLINWLFPDSRLATQTVSENSRLGQHTTTASQLFLLESSDNSNQKAKQLRPNDKGVTQGFIIDSPGIREFGLWHLEDNKIANGFIEFRPFLGGCKFRDCKHLNEPGCAIIQAVNDSKISDSRWRNYTKILLNNEKN